MPQDYRRVFIIYESGDQPLLDYTIRQLRDADPSLMLHYNTIRDTGEGNFDYLQEAHCILAIWTPGAKGRDERYVSESQHRKSTALKPKFRTEAEIALHKSTRDPSLPMIVALWYTDACAALPSAEAVKVEHTFAEVISRVLEKLDLREVSKPRQGYTPIDLLTLESLNFALAALSNAFQDEIEMALEEVINEAEGGFSHLDNIAVDFRGPRACLFWKPPGSTHMYIVAAQGDYTLSERRLGIRRGQIGVGELWERWSPAIPDTYVSYSDFSKAPGKDLAADAQNIVQTIGPLLVLPVIRANQLVGAVAIDCSVARPMEILDEQPVSALYERIETKWKQLADRYDTLTLDDSTEAEEGGGHGTTPRTIRAELNRLATLVPDYPLSLRHYLNIRRILNVARLFPNLSLPVRASLFHVNQWADGDSARYSPADVSAELGKAHIHMSIVSPALDDDDARAENIERVWNASYQRGVGLAGRVWERRIALDEDRASKTEKDLKQEHKFTDAQVKAVFPIKSIICLPVEALTDENEASNTVIGVLSITSRHTMGETRLREYLSEYWNLAHLIERILTDPPPSP